LGLINCPNITRIPDLPDNFTCLYVFRCSNLKYFGHMNLTKLTISNCPKIEFIPSIENLKIQKSNDMDQEFIMRFNHWIILECMYLKEFLLF
jgi:hypothetical protein